MQIESKIQLRDRNQAGVIIWKARALYKVNKIDVLTGGWVQCSWFCHTVEKAKWKLRWQCKKKSNHFATVTKYKIMISC